MKIGHIIFFSLFAFTALAGDTNAPSSSVAKKYDAAVFEKISGRWFELVDAMPVKNPPPTGRVVLEFHIFPDGHISGLKAVGTNVDETLAAPCKRAVLDSVPFASWPVEMRQAYTNDFRVLSFPFVY